jgi:hypothetical protein
MHFTSLVEERITQVIRSEGMPSFSVRENRFNRGNSNEQIPDLILLIIRLYWVLLI